MRGQVPPEGVAEVLPVISPLDPGVKTDASGVNTKILEQSSKLVRVERLASSPIRPWTLFEPGQQIAYPLRGEPVSLVLLK